FQCARTSRLAHAGNVATGLTCAVSCSTACLCTDAASESESDNLPGNRRITQSTGEHGRKGSRIAVCERGRAGITQRCSKSANSESLRSRSRQVRKGLGKIRRESANPGNCRSKNARCKSVYIRCAKTDIAVESQGDRFTGKRRRR